MSKVLARITPSEPWGLPVLNAEYDMQAIRVASNSLFDVARTANTGADACKLAKDLQELRDRLNIVIDRALARADELSH